MGAIYPVGSDPFLAANGAGCNPNPKELISEIDFGYLADIGYDIADVNVANQPETYGLGAWGQYSAWGVGVERLLYRDNAFVYGDLSSVDPNEPKRMQPLGGNYVIHDELRATADAFGISPLASFDTVHGADLGSATYTGGLLGVDRGQAMLPPVVGDAQLHVAIYRASKERRGLRISRCSLKMARVPFGNRTWNMP